MGRAISINELLTQKRRIMLFDGAFRDLVGEPEIGGTWIIWGASTSGKTHFALQLSKYLAHFGRVAYNSREEGNSLSLAQAFEQAGMAEIKSSKIILLNESLPELTDRLSKHKSPQIIVIDSLQYLGINYTEYKALREQFPGKLFIFISHAKGREPSGSVAQKIRYDAMVKIRIEGFKAFPSSRYGGNIPYTIWPEGAAKYWGLYDGTE